MLSQNQVKAIESKMREIPCPKCACCKEVCLTYTKGVCVIGGYCCEEHRAVLQEFFRHELNRLIFLLQ